MSDPPRAVGRGCCKAGGALQLPDDGHLGGLRFNSVKRSGFAHAAKNALDWPKKGQKNLPRHEAADVAMGAPYRFTLLVPFKKK